MAEIKSTMELVMERTRNLTMSEEERREQQAAEFRAGLNRLIQRYLQSDLDKDRFQKELSRLEKDFPGPDLPPAAAEIAKRIDPDEDNGPLLKLLRDGCEKDVAGIEALLGRYVENADLVAALASGKILEDLIKFGISGTAVIPNISADKDLAEERERMLEEFRVNLADQIGRLK